jgi:PAS domain S-box-containing protein
MEYDGINWRKIATPVGSWTLSVAADSNGTIYVGMFGDFGYLAPDSIGKMQYISLLEHVDKNDRDFAEVWRIHSTKSGVYFRSNNKIFLWSGHKIKVFGTKSRYSLTAALDDTLYVEERGYGLMRTTGQSLELIPDSKRFNPLRFVSILPYKDQYKLVCTTQGLLLFDGKTFSPFDSPVNDFIRKNTLSSAAVLPGGNYAFGTYQGGVCIMSHNGDIVQWLNKSTGLRNDDVKNLYCDSEGILWLSLNSGIAKISARSPISFFNEIHGLEGNVVSITRHKKILYMATSQAVYYLQSTNQDNKKGSGQEGFKLPQFKRVKGITNQGFWLLSTENGLLVAVGGRGVYQIKHDRATRIDFDNSGAFVLSQSKKDENMVFAGLKNGLEILQYKNNKWIASGRVKGIKEEIRTIVEEEGILWLGTVFQGILRVRLISHDSEGWNADITRFNQIHGLPDGPVNISKINGNWVFATHKGHRRFEKSESYFYPDSSITPELSDTTRSAAWVEQNQFNQIFVWPINDDGKPEIWMGEISQDGKIGINKRKFRSLMNFGIFHTTYTESDSVIWIGCSTGLVRFDPRIVQNTQFNFPVQIRKISSISSDSLIFAGYGSGETDPLVLPFNDNSLRFEFSVPFFDNISENRYQYFLEGFDNDWSNWTNESKKDYTNLEHGKHVFRVRARNIFGEISRISEYMIEIQSPLHLTWWAYTIYSLFAIFILYLLYRIFRSQLVKRELKKAELREAEIVNQKNKELQLKNEELEDILSKLQIAQNSLIESESRFRSVAESANDALITADKTGNITFWNKSATSIFGYTQKEILGKSLTILMPERYRKAHLKGLNRFYSTGQEKIMGHVVELEAVNKAGKEFPIELTLANWDTHNERFVTGIVRDMTVRKQKEEALRNTQTQLFQSEKLSTLGKLSAGIAHELNNPAGSTMRSSAQLQKAFIDLQIGNLEIGRLNLKDEQINLLSELDQRAKSRAENSVQIAAPSRIDKEQELEKWLENQKVNDSWKIAPVLLNLGFNSDELNSLLTKFQMPQFSTVIYWLCTSYSIYSLLSEISLGTDRIAEIVEAFKSYTYMDQAPIQRINIQKDLENTLVLFHSKLKNRITVIREYDEKLPKIEAYGGQLNQVWTNIIDNAIEAMGSGGELTLMTQTEKSWVRVEIIDNGPGIPKKNQSKIFDPFFTTKKIGTGTGLGLNLSHNIIVQNHQGQITFSSEPGRTRFIIRLPLSPKRYSDSDV